MDRVGCSGCFYLTLALSFQKSGEKNIQKFEYFLTAHLAVFRAVLHIIMIHPFPGVGVQAAFRMASVLECGRCSALPYPGRNLPGGCLFQAYALK